MGKHSAAAYTHASRCNSCIASRESSLTISRWLLHARTANSARGGYNSRAIVRTVLQKITDKLLRARRTKRWSKHLHAAQIPRAMDSPNTCTLRRLKITFIFG